MSFKILTMNGWEEFGYLKFKLRSKRPRMVRCKACSTNYSSESLEVGSNHKNCKVSPRGRVEFVKERVK